MKKTVKIGFLAPYSSIYPGLVPSLISGFYSAIPEAYHPLFQIVPEYVGQGGEKVAAAAAKKLLFFDQVDLLSGIISQRVLPSLVSSVESRKKVALFFDSGEYIPSPEVHSESVFCNSFQLWQSEFALGHWAHSHFGEKGAVVMPIYDGGYHLQSAFRQGASMAGSEVMDYHVLEYQPDASQVTGQIQSLFDKIKKESPAYIHALFCGTEAHEFFAEFAKSGLNGHVPLLVSGHMASEEILGPMSHLSLDFYAASLWNYHSIEKGNVAFKKQVQQFAGQKPDWSTLLGYETGLLFHQLIPAFERGDWDEVKARLRTEVVEGPRGKRSFCLSSEHATPEIDIEKVGFYENKVRKIVVERGRAMPHDSETYRRIHTENVSGWQNPYLCV